MTLNDREYNAMMTLLNAVQVLGDQHQKLKDDASDYAEHADFNELRVAVARVLNRANELIFTMVEEVK